MAAVASSSAAAVRRLNNAELQRLEVNRMALAIRRNPDTAGRIAAGLLYALPFEVKEGSVEKKALDILIAALQNIVKDNISPLRDLNCLFYHLRKNPLIYFIITHSEYIGLQDVLATIRRQPCVARDEPRLNNLLGFVRLFESTETFAKFFNMSRGLYKQITNYVLNYEQFLKAIFTEDNVGHSITFQGEPFYLKKLQKVPDEPSALLRDAIGIYEIDFPSGTMIDLTADYESELVSANGLRDIDLFRSLDLRCQSKDRTGFAITAGCHVATDMIPLTTIAAMYGKVGVREGTLNPQFGSVKFKNSSAHAANLSAFPVEYQKTQPDVLYSRTVEQIKYSIDYEISRHLDFIYWFLVKNIPPAANVELYYTSKMRAFARALYAGVSKNTIVRLLSNLFRIPYIPIKDELAFYGYDTRKKAAAYAYQKAAPSVSSEGLEGNGTNVEFPIPSAANFHSPYTGNTNAFTHDDFTRLKEIEDSRRSPISLRAYANSLQDIAIMKGGYSLSELLSVVTGRLNEVRRQLSSDPRNPVARGSQQELLRVLNDIYAQRKAQEDAAAVSGTPLFDGAAVSSSSAAAAAAPSSSRSFVGAKASAGKNASSASEEAPLRSELPVPENREEPDAGLLDRASKSAGRIVTTSHGEPLLTFKDWVEYIVPKNKKVAVKSYYNERETTHPVIRPVNTSHIPGGRDLYARNNLTSPGYGGRTISTSRIEASSAGSKYRKPSSNSYGGRGGGKRKNNTRKSKTHKSKSKPKRKTRSKH